MGWLGYEAIDAMRRDDDSMRGATGRGLLDATTPLLRDDESEGEDLSHSEPPWLARYRLLLAIGGSITFLSTASFLPVFNKRLFSRDFHFPLFTTSVYLLFCTLAGGAYFVCKWLVAKCTDASAGLGDLYYTTGEYWRNIVKATWMIGIAFGLKLGLTNYGLDLVSVDYHVLFAATALGWVALFGFVLLREVPSPWDWFLIALMTLGQILLSLQFTSESQATILGLVVNLATPAMQGVCVVLMRYTSLLLFPKSITKHKEGGAESASNSFRILNLSCIMSKYSQTFQFNLDTLVAYTTVKLLFSFLACLPFTLTMEGVFAKRPFWDAINGVDAGFLFSCLIMGGAVTFFLQASLVLMGTLSVALTLGILSVVKVLPQLLVGIVFSLKSFEPTPLHVSGISLILASSFGYVLLKVRRSKSA